MPKKLVIIGSTNPVKISAVQEAFEQCFPDTDFEFHPCTVSSGVSDQPMGDDEILQGATNRAESAKREYPDAHFWVGLEGGCEDTSRGMESWAWMVVLSNDLKGIGSTGRFSLPEQTAQLVRDGMELGHATDALHNRSNSKQSEGTTGVLTHGALPRKEYYVHGVILALIPFLNLDLYK